MVSFRHAPLSRCLLTGFAAALALTLAACGSEKPEPPPTGGAGSPAPPALLERKLRRGEILVSAEASPRREGPFRFEGRYRVRFVQYAPEAPNRGFAGQTPFVASLLPAGDPRARPLPLFHAAAESAERSLRIQGRYLVDVAFGDFPYALRFTPLR